MTFDLSTITHNFNPFIIIGAILFIAIIYNIFVKNQDQEEEEKTPYEIISDVIKLDYQEQLRVLGMSIKEAGYSLGSLWYHYYKIGEILSFLQFKFNYIKPVKKTIKKKVAGTEIEETTTENKTFEVEYLLLEVVKTIEVNTESNFILEILKILSLGLINPKKRNIRSDIFLLRKDLVQVNIDYNTRELHIIIPEEYHIIKYNGVWVIDDEVNRLHPEAVSDRIKFNEISAQLTLLPVKMAFLQEGVAMAMASYEKQKEMLEFQKQLKEEGIRKEI
jgi:hypothetical protein